VVIHAPIEALTDHGSGEIEGGPVIHPQVVRRLLCEARVQSVLEDGAGEVVGVGRMSRAPGLDAPPAPVPGLRLRLPRVRGPPFHPGSPHQVVGSGGRTDLNNLVLLCFFHHRLVHEHGWSLTRDADGTVEWRRPNGTRYWAGPAPPSETLDGRSALAAAGVV
jgi:hypothetical protein